MTFFKYATPATYYILVILWGFIMGFCMRRLQTRKLENRLILILLGVLAIDAFRTLFESLFFGAWYTSVVGFLPQAVHDYLVQPQIVFVPKLLNVVVAAVIIFIILRRWLPEEERNLEFMKTQKRDLTTLVEAQTAELRRTNERLVKEVNARKQAADAIRQSERRYHDLYHSAPVAILSIGTEGHILVANKAAEVFTGYGLVELQSIKVFDLYAEESKGKAKQIFEKFRRGISSENEEIIYIRKDGQKTSGLLSISPVKDENGQILQSRSVIVDITKRKLAEEELEKHREHLEELVQERTAQLGRRVEDVEYLNRAMVNLLEDLRASNANLETTTGRLAEANKELEAFSYSVSHDLRSPLRAISGFSRMLVEDYMDKLDSDGQHQLDVIQSSARDMGQLIDDLLAFSRMGRKEMSSSVIDMDGLVREVFEKLQLAPEASKARLKAEELAPASGDLAMIREVFFNLLTNAIKFSKPRKTPVIEVGCRAEGEDHIYSVKDNGVGFDMKYADKLFRVFQRLHSTEEFEGTGIGLALVQRIIHRHSGRVWAEGKVSQGATFYFSLPRDKEREDG